MAKNETYLYFCEMFRNIILIIIATFVVSCQKETIPKPSGELRLTYPEPAYQKFDDGKFYTFEFSNFAKVYPSEKIPHRFKLIYPEMKAKVFLNYYPINDNFVQLARDAEKLVYEHTVKASAIETKFFEYPEKKVYGNFYELKGQSASNIQFFITDSTRHFVSASLYFNSRPKPDSIAPAVEYVKKDLKHLIDTFEWK